MSGAPTRILIADDHSTFAELFALGLEREPDLEAVGHARTAAEAVQLTESLDPDIVIMDVRLGDGDGIEVTAQLTERYADLCVIILTGHPDSVGGGQGGPGRAHAASCPRAVHWPRCCTPCAAPGAAAWCCPRRCSS